MQVGSWRIGNVLTFVCNTHSPTTGAAVDADSAPLYRIYKDNTTPPLSTGTFTLFDGANTDGFYFAQVTLNSGLGYAYGSQYTIFVQATVGGITATMSHAFQMGSAADLVWMLGTLLTETAGQLAAAFKQFFDVSSPTGTMKSITNVVTATNLTTNNDKTGYALTAGERLSVADAYLDRADAIEVGLTPRQAHRLEAAASAGVLSGAASTTILIKNAVANSKTRITATVDTDGNRSVVSTDVT